MSIEAVIIKIGAENIRAEALYGSNYKNGFNTLAI